LRQQNAKNKPSRPKKIKNQAKLSEIERTMRQDKVIHQRRALTEPQFRAIAALLTSPNISAAARLAQVPRRTLYDWFRQDAFQQALRNARHDAMAQTTTRLQYLSDLATEALETVIQDKKAPPATRVSAARTALALSYRSLELDDIDARLRNVEALHELAILPKDTE
jgi:hypothetical protein